MKTCLWLPLACLVGFVVGFALSVVIILLREFFDITIRTEEDVTQAHKYPLLAAVPDMAAPSKGGYYYANGKKAEKKKAAGHGKQPELVGPDISFAATEAYKLLRTKLQFSFTDDHACHVIGVSSALSGEGKSLSAVNLAYSLSQLDKKVLLIDCDMRRPTVAAKLPITQRHRPAAGQRGFPVGGYPRHLSGNGNRAAEGHRHPQG